VLTELLQRTQADRGFDVGRGFAMSVAQTTLFTPERTTGSTSGLGLALGSAWTWFVFGFFTLLVFFLQLLSVPLTWPFDRRRVVTGRLFRLAAVWTAKLSPLWHFDVHGALPARAPRRTVVVGNHCSGADPFLISFLPWEMKWLAKASMFKIPVAGLSLHLAGDIPVVRGDRDSGSTALRRCAYWLEREMPVMIFPEGTRSSNGSLAAFKDGAFRLAIEAGADVLPIAVAGTSTVLPKHSWRMRRSHAVVTVGQPIGTRGLTLADVDTLKAQAREQIVGLLEEIEPLV
jgi:1-acyl-sn-glycerol-3-phosphate acyltransferase